LTSFGNRLVAERLYPVVARLLDLNPSGTSPP
jgi:hypothetical protein